jgi:hypothetical protein
MGTTRKTAQEKIAQSTGHIDKAGQALFAFKIMYEQEHPELSIPCEIILEGLAKTIDAIELLSESF